jgi:hypothetical protein
MLQSGSIRYEHVRPAENLLGENSRQQWYVMTKITEKQSDIKLSKPRRAAI